jgi:hypothetical protein
LSEITLLIFLLLWHSPTHMFLTFFANRSWFSLYCDFLNLPYIQIVDQATCENEYPSSCDVTGLLLMVVLQCLFMLITVQTHASFLFLDVFLCPNSLLVYSYIGIVYSNNRYPTLIRLDHNISHLHLTFSDLILCWLLTHIWMSHLTC